MANQKIYAVSEAVNQSFDESQGAFKTTANTASAGEDISGDVLKVETRWNSGIPGGPVSGSTLLKNGVGQFSGLICTASGTGVIRIWDSTSAAGTKILDSITLTAGQIIAVPNGSYSFSVGCYFELLSGTATVTPFLR